MCDGTIREQDLPERVRRHKAEVQPGVRSEASEVQEVTEWVTLAEVEGRYVARVLAHTGGNKQAASRILGVDRKTLDRMIKRHDISIGNLSQFPLRRHIPRPVVQPQPRYHF